MAGVHMLFFLFMTVIFACSNKKPSDENSSAAEVEHGTKI